MTSPLTDKVVTQSICFLFIIIAAKSWAHRTFTTWLSFRSWPNRRIRLHIEQIDFWHGWLDRDFHLLWFKSQQKRDFCYEWWVGFRFPVPFAPFVLAQERHWTTNEIGFSHKTNSMFVNGLYARHETRWRRGDNLVAQLVKLFPSCQFAAFEFETVLKRAIEGILDDIHTAGILASNCTGVELNTKSNSTLEFAIDQSRLRDLRQLNMSHCFDGKLFDLQSAWFTAFDWPVVLSPNLRLDLHLDVWHARR